MISAGWLRLSASGRTLGCMAGRVTRVDDVVQGIEQAVCDGLDQLLRATGAVQPPTVHMFVTDPHPAYLGLVTCRAFYPGDDAADAVAKLGHLPAAVEATRLLVTFEAQDLNVALDMPVDPDGSALVVVDATMTETVLRWYPLHLSRARHGHPALVPRWGVPEALREPTLPEPLIRALIIWRRARGGYVPGQVAELERGGYRISWYE